MATREQWMEALRKADAAAQEGDQEAIADAKRITAKIREIDAAGGGGGAPQDTSQPGIIERIAGSMSESGRRTREAVMHPLQSAQDLLRTTSNFVTLGGRDLAAPYLGSGRTAEQERAETSAADERLGSINEAVNLGAAFLQPSAAVSTPLNLGRAGKALAFGGEGAALSGAQSVIGGGSPRDVVTDTLLGGAAGGGGSAAGDLFTGARNLWRGAGKPRQRTPEELYTAADRTPRNTREGKDLASRSERMKQVELAESERSFKDLAADTKLYGGFPHQEQLAINRLASSPRQSLGDVLSKGGEVLRGGGGAFTKGMMLAALPKVAAAGMAAQGVGSLMKGGQAKEIQALKDLVAGSGGTVEAVDPTVLRDALAKIFMGAQRQQ